jgi:hypothetical protein
MGGVTAVWVTERHSCCWEKRANEIAAELR